MPAATATFPPLLHIFTSRINSALYAGGHNARRREHIRRGGITLRVRRTFVGSVHVEKLSLTSVLWLTRVARIKKKLIQPEQIEIEPIFTKSRLR